MTTLPIARPSRARRWLIGSAVALVLALTLLAFGLSYSVLQDLAARSGIPAEVTWAWPLIVDGAIVVTMVVIFAQRGRGRRANALPWTALVLFALVSVVGNGIHTAAVHDVAQGISMPVAIGVGAVPPIALLVASEMLVRLLAPHEEQAPVAQASVEVDLEAVPAPIAAVETVPTAVPQLEANAKHVPEAGPDPVAELEPTIEPVSDVVSQPKPADQAATEAEASAEDTATSPEPTVAPMARLHAVEKVQESIDPVPTEKDEQVDWVIAQALAGEEVTRERLAERLAVSVRTAQRRLAEAREKAPEAFAETSETEDLVQVS